jgi:hypothetical protein
MPRKLSTPTIWAPRFSPYDRRDLQQDPYFLLYRGELTEFERQVNTQTQARREFLLQQRAAL